MGLTSDQAKGRIENKECQTNCEKNIYIRPYQNGDEFEVSDIICETLRVCSAKDYPADFIEENIISHSPQVIARRAENTHFYVVCAQQKIIGCGGITYHKDSTTESDLRTIFVLQEYQGRGIGKLIVETLENDEYNSNAWRTEVGSLISAVNFYRKLGYDFKNGITTPDETHLVRLEKKNFH